MRERVKPGKLMSFTYIHTYIYKIKMYVDIKYSCCDCWHTSSSFLLTQHFCCTVHIQSIVMVHAFSVFCQTILANPKVNFKKKTCWLHTSTSVCLLIFKLQSKCNKLFWFSFNILQFAVCFLIAFFLTLEINWITYVWFCEWRLEPQWHLVVSVCQLRSSSSCEWWWSLC